MSKGLAQLCNECNNCYHCAIGVSFTTVAPNPFTVNHVYVIFSSRTYTGGHISSYGQFQEKCFEVLL